MLGQLIAALLAIELVLLAVDPGGLLEDLLRDLPVITVGVLDAFACTFVPSTAITPTFTNPARGTTPAPR